MRSFRPMLWPTLFGLLALSILISLGTWQVQRLGQKLDLIEAAEVNSMAVPVPLDQILKQQDGDLTTLRYRRVIVRGTFDHSRELHLFSVLDQGRIGYQIITPLIRSNGSTVMVDRGFVPTANKEISTRAEGQISGVVEITGLIHLATIPNRFSAKPDLKSNEWFERDLGAMATALGINPVAPVFVDADETPNTGGWPEGGQTRLEFRNAHLGYAITWYGLALALIGVYVAFHKANGRFGRI